MISCNLTQSISRQEGFSLIEIMIALVIGLLISVGAINIFVASKQTFRMQEAFSGIQENGRFAMGTLEFRLRMMGYTGCYGNLSSGVENRLNNPGNFAWDISNTIEGFDDVPDDYEIGGNPDLTATGGTDVLVLRGMSDGVPLSVSSDSTQFTIDSGNDRFEVGDALLVTGCDEASVFQATGVSTSGNVTTITHVAGGMTPGNTLGNLDFLYGTDAEIARLETFVYYISTGDNGRPALFEARLVFDSGTLGLQSTELAQNFEDLQIVYGVDTDSDRDVDAYQNAGSVSDWQNVISVRLSALVASEDDYLISKPRSYSFDANAFTYTKDATPSANADRRLKRPFNGFIALRNRTL